MKTKWVFRIFIFLIIVYVLYVVINLSINSKNYFWDFKMYCLSTNCLNKNLNPYNTDDLAKLGGIESNLPFAYPPLTLNFFKLFNFKNSEFAAILFMIFELLLFIFIIFIWRKILNIKNDILFYLFIFLAFNSSVYLGLRAGNITMFVQFILWIGIYFYLKRKYVLFCAFTVLAATFKLMPITFLILLLFTNDRRKYVYFLLSSTTFIIYLALNYLVQPFLFVEFVKTSIGILDERRIINPVLFWFIKDFLQQFLGNRLGLDYSKLIGIMLYVLIISLISIITFKSIRKMLKKTNISSSDRELFLVFLFCFVYSFIMPRFKDYDYILLIAPTYFIIRHMDYIINPKYLLIFICLISATYVTLPGLKIIYFFMWNYYPLFLALISWSLYISYIFKSSNSTESKTSVYV
jgi:hypothetical protein